MGALIMDEEVQAVIVALAVVASVFASAMILRQGVVAEPFDAIGLLDESCKIGYYPTEALVGGNVTLCIFISNYMGEPEYYKVVYKVGTNETLPTNTTPSPEPAVMEWRVALPHGGNTTFLVEAPFNPPPGYRGLDRVALIFELWRYDAREGGWVYTGKWVHLYVRPVEPMVPAG